MEIISLIIAILIFCGISFLGGLIYGIQKQIGAVLNVAGIILFLIFGISFMITDFNEPMNRTYGEDFMYTILSVFLVMFCVLSWYAGQSIGKFLKTIRITWEIK